MNTKLKGQTTVLILATASIVVILSALLWSPAAEAQTQPVVAAREVLLIDNRGVTRARLGLTPDDIAVSLELNNAQGLRQISFIVGPGGPIALLWDKDGGGAFEPRFEIPSISFVDRNNKIRASFPSASEPQITQLGNRVSQLEQQLSRRTAPIPGQAAKARSVPSDNAEALQSQISQLSSRVSQLEQQLSRQ